MQPETCLKTVDRSRYDCPRRLLHDVDECDELWLLERDRGKLINVIVTDTLFEMIVKKIGLKVTSLQSIDAVLPAVMFARKRVFCARLSFNG
jgi:hypothetical protein